MPMIVTLAPALTHRIENRLTNIYESRCDFLYFALALRKIL